MGEQTHDSLQYANNIALEAVCLIKSKITDNLFICQHSVDHIEGQIPSGLHITRKYFWLLPMIQDSLLPCGKQFRARIDCLCCYGSDLLTESQWCHPLVNLWLTLLRADSISFVESKK
jgi:hypothetical protein